MPNVRLLRSPKTKPVPVVPIASPLRSLLSLTRFKVQRFTVQEYKRRVKEVAGTHPFQDRSEVYARNSYDRKIPISSWRKIAY